MKLSEILDIQIFLRFKGEPVAELLYDYTFDDIIKLTAPNTVVTLMARS